VTRLNSAAQFASTTALLVVSLAAGGAPAPTAGEMAHCAAIAAPDTRLACYDALAGRSVDRSAPSAGVAAAAPNAPIAPTARAARAAASAPAATSASAPASANPATATAAAAAPAAGDAASFGFTAAQVHAAPVGPTSIQAHISKVTTDQLGRTYLVLDNGQMWTSSDSEAREDAHMGPGDPVTIKKGALGSFVMVTDSRRTYHVHRSQ
jgi:hypothetical protein